MFKNIYIEHEVANNSITSNILKAFPKVPSKEIDKVEDIWGRVKKPYLQKRDNLNLFIGAKKGTLIKKTPDAYGVNSGEHYYFIHAYNCIYECKYCYLQGYFQTPDIVLYVNHDEILEEMQKIIDTISDEVWFHAGEFSDSLALSHITGEWQQYFEFFKANPKAKLELRTKSVNIKSILDLEPLDNVIVSFSLSPEQEAKQYDLKTPPTKLRLKAIKQLSDKGFQIGLHFDPVIYSPDYLEKYQELIEDVLENCKEKLINYLSIGVVRFPKKIYKEVVKNYPDSPLLAQEFSSTTDEMMRYPRPMRMKILNDIKKACIKAGLYENKVYLCME
jgi:spore photoproduct lyase